MTSTGGASAWIIQPARPLTLGTHAWFRQASWTPDRHFRTFGDGLGDAASAYVFRGMSSQGEARRLSGRGLSRSSPFQAR